MPAHQSHPPTRSKRLKAVLISINQSSTYTDGKFMPAHPKDTKHFSMPLRSIMPKNDEIATVNKGETFAIAKPMTMAFHKEKMCLSANEAKFTRE
jgi:hypothetical protein